MLDELIELTLQGVRPNFSECWWDSVVLDVLLANSLGIFLGMKTIQLVGAGEYDWLGRKGKGTVRE